MSIHPPVHPAGQYPPMSIRRLATDTHMFGYRLGLASRMKSSSVPTAAPVVPVPIAVSLLTAPVVPVPIAVSLLAAAPVVPVRGAVELMAAPVVAVPIAVSLSVAPVVLFRLVPVCW
jgi:hypothetical protein